MANALMLRRRAAAAPTFTPAKLSGLEWWMDATDLALADGAAVPTWSDRSGNAYTLAQATGANQPTFAATGCNGHPAVRFGGSKWMDGNAPAGNKPVTRIALVRVDDPGTSQNVWDAQGTGGFAVVADVSQAPAGQVLVNQQFVANLAWGQVTFPKATWAVFAWTYSSAGAYTFTMDTVAGVSGTNNVTPTARGTRIGADHTGGGTLTGYVASLIQYNRVLSSAEIAQVDTYLRGRFSLPSAPTDVLTIPAYDGKQSHTHPDVIDLGAGNSWNGHRYWLGITPYPNDPRENPSVYSSDDGVTWATPTGVTEPVIPVAEATGAGYTFNADPDILMQDNGTTMEMYALRATASTSQVIRTTSTDGWQTRTATAGVITDGASAASLLSPGVINEGGTNRSMIVCTGTAMKRYTSTDSGATWSGPTSCTLPGWLTQPWHVNINKIGSTYHALVNVKPNYTLRHLTSSDGLTWTGNDVDVIAKTGCWVDAGGFYRSAMTTTDAGTTWTIWASCQPIGDGLSGVWRTRRVTGVTLP